MKRHAIHGIAAAICILSLLIFSCSDSENRHLALLNQAKVVIDLGMPKEHASAGIMDKILRLFARDAIAQTAPATFGQIKVRITGPDIGVIEKDFGAYDTITMNVKAGTLRQFEVIAYVAPGDPSAALSFRGTTVATLPAGSTVAVFVEMGLYETKIVAPDNVATTAFPYSTTRRIIMMDDINGTGFASLTQTEVTLSSGSFVPYDVSFDSRGRIYIANNSTIGMIRIDNINGNNLIQGSTTRFATLAGVAVSSVQTVAVDRINNFVFFATTNALYRSDLNGLNTQTLSLPTAFTSNNFVRGIDVDSEGMLYIVGPPLSLGDTQIFKYDPNLQVQIGTEYNTPASVGPYTVFDVMVKGQYIYVANVAGAAGNQILQLSFSDNAVNLVSNNGTRNTGATQPGEFFGASRFVAIRNDGFIIIDSNQGFSGADYDRLLYFNDMSFNGWTPYGSFNITGNGDAPNAFRFYSQC